MASVAELIFRPVLGDRYDDISRTTKQVFGDAADQARAKIRQRVGEKVAASPEGRRIKREYVLSQAQIYAPYIVAGVLGILVLMALAKRS